MNHGRVSDQRTHELPHPMSFKVASNRVVITTIVAVVSGVVQLSLAKLLGPTEFGVFTFIISIIGLGTSFSVLFGLMAPAIRLYGLESDHVARVQLSSWILRISLVASVISSVVLLIGSGIFSPFFEWSLVLALVFLPFVVRVRANGGVLSAIGRADIAAFATLVAPTASLLVVLLLIWSELTPPLAVVLIIGWAFGQFAATILSGYMRRRLLPRTEGSERQAAPDVRAKWMRRSWPIVVSKTLSSFMSNTDVALLGVLVSDIAVVGNYGIALRVYAFALIGVNSAQVSYGPRLARAIEVRDGGVARRELFRARCFATGIAIVCSLFVLFVLPYLVYRFVPKYELAIIPSQMLVLSTLLAAATGPLGIMINSMNKERLLLVLNTSLLLVTILLCLLLIPFFGIIGVASAVVATQVVRTTVLLVLERRVKDQLLHFQKRTDEG